MAKKVKRAAGAWIYVLQGDRALPESEQTQFMLRPLTGAERDFVRDNISRPGQGRDGTPETVKRMYQEVRQLCLTHIESIERFPIDAPLAWPKDQDARAKYLEMLDDDDVLEVGNEIWVRSSLTEDTKDGTGAVIAKGEATVVGESSPPAPTSN